MRLLLVVLVLLVSCSCSMLDLDEIRRVATTLRDAAERVEESSEWDTDESGDLSLTEILLGLLGLLGVGGSALAGRSAVIAHRRIERRVRVPER